MSYNNYLIIKNNYYSFLLCDKKLINFYKKFEWKNLNYKIKINIKNKKFKNKKILSYNLNIKSYKKINLLSKFNYFFKVCNKKPTGKINYVNPIVEKISEGANGHKVIKIADKRKI